MKKELLLICALAIAGTLGAQEGQNASLSVDLKVGTAVENRTIVGEADSFPADTAMLAAWSHIKGAQEPTQVQHVWIHEGKEMAPISLNVTSSSYRTWSRKELQGRTGGWRIEVRDADGRTLASKDIQVGGAAAPQ